MQGGYQNLRNQLWTKLETLYNKYSERKGGEIPTSKVQLIIFQALGQQTQQEIDYVVKNMFRLDNDESGSISFQQFGNFLFKRHCGQMSLQKMHMNNQIKNGAQRKITLDQFHKLMNNAYKFLKVQCPYETSKQIFTQTDTDHDNLMTYVQYFTVIDRYICKSKNQKVLKLIQETGKQRNSRLRLYIWLQLKKLYEAYIHGRYLSANDHELRLLVTTIVGDLSQAQISFILTDLFKLNMKFIQFDPFASHFIYLIAQLSISKYSRYHLIAKKTMNKQQFAVLFKNTYSFLSIGRIKLSFLYLVFGIIDKNKDGIINYEEYLDWIRRFLSVLKYYGDQFYFREDDIDVQGQDMFEIQRRPVQIKRSSNHITFNFSDHTLAYAVRQRMYSLLIQYDTNKDELFNEDQIKIALTELLKEDPIELRYVTQNVFRYDRDGDKHVTYDQFTNFSVQQHFGQMAIQRLHKRNFYSRGKERIMNQKQFADTLNYSLAYIHLQATPLQIKTLFSQIDLDHDGWISYEVYFFFLKQYFGSMSIAAQKPSYQAQTKIGKLSQDQNLMYVLQKLSVLERFVRLLLDQLRDICMQYDFNKNMVFEPQQVQAILSQVFQLSRDEISYIMYNFFRFDVRKQKAATYEELIAIVLQIYFIEILFKRKYHSQNTQIWINKRISIPQFLDLLYDSTFFIRIRPIRQDLLTIFEILDRDKDGFITFEEYINFIRKYLGRGLQIVDQPAKQIILKSEPVTQGISQQQLAFVQAIWSQLKIYFNKYDKGSKGYLNQEELKLFAIDVLHESSKRELDYIFWNLFRVDSNSNHQVDFQQFAPFILNHAGQIALQRFHRQQTKGKDSLSQDELYIVLSSAYAFLGSMPKNRPAIANIFKRISKGSTVSYSNLLQWVHNSLSKKFR